MRSCKATIRSRHSRSAGSQVVILKIVQLAFTNLSLCNVSNLLRKQSFFGVRSMTTFGDFLTLELASANVRYRDFAVAD
jgi:hypothetical protein